MSTLTSARKRTFCILTLAVAAAVSATLAPAGAAPKPGGPPGQSVEVQLLAINDFHGNLLPPGGSIAGIPTGGAEYLATHIRNSRRPIPTPWSSPPAT